jgi:hypothetical protein
MSVKSWMLASGVAVLALGTVTIYWLAGMTSGEETVSPGSHPGWFIDVTDAVGLDFVHDSGPVDGNYFLPQIMGSGAAVFDFDGDGRLDLYLLTNGGPQARSTNRLYKNMPDGKFTDVTEGSGLGIAGYNMGVAIGDVNNDGLPDVLLTQYDGIKLLLNRGGGKFEDVTVSAGLANPGWGVSAAFLDYDRDGWLDLVVVNYLDYDPSWACKGLGGGRDYCAPGVFSGTVTRLFHNEGAATGTAAAAGPAVSFHDVTLASGLGKVPGPGLGVLCADFDGDGWPDIFVANDRQPNRLWINQHDGTFKDGASLRGVAYSGLGTMQAGMGVAHGDVDSDGLMDLLVTHLRIENHTLWKQGPRGLFLDRTGASGLARTARQGTGFGVVLADFDHDGHLDLAVVNGDVGRGAAPAPAGRGPHWDWYAQRNQLLVNDGQGRFTDVSLRQEAFCQPYNIGRGLAWGDLDGDGKIDLVVTSIGERARIWRNVAPGTGHWLRVAARTSCGGQADRRIDRDALGAEVTVEAGTRRWIRLINSADSYLCSSDPCAHFGLGTCDRAERLLVHWPDGTREQFPGTAVDRVITLCQGQGRPME